MTATAEATGLRERKKARTREALIDAAMTLFEEQGYEATTVDAIAAAAEVSRRTFFRYFESKESIVFPRYADQIADFLAVARQRAPEETGLEAIRRGCMALGDRMQRNAREMLLLQNLILANPPLLSRERLVDLQWEEAFEQILRESVDDPELEVRTPYVAAALIGVLRAAFREWYAGECREDLIALGGRAIDLVIDGMDPVLRKAGKDA